MNVKQRIEKQVEIFVALHSFVAYPTTCGMKAETPSPHSMAATPQSYTGRLGSLPHIHFRVFRVFRGSQPSDLKAVSPLGCHRTPKLIFLLRRTADLHVHLHQPGSGFDVV